MAIELIPAGDRPAAPGNPEWFSGIVSITPIVSAPDPARVRAASVRFEPGARTAWHTHPLGQTLLVVSGSGLIASRGSRPRRISAGDTVWIPPGEEHWHGAAPDSAMEHIAIHEAEAGFVAAWMECVSDEDYLEPPA